jgi:hypothetical protein
MGSFWGIPPEKTILSERELTGRIFILPALMHS